ncbi:MAG TPA: Eco57I restriction-modification methylase domain-containing protein [bacterium]|nr:Eco57I restriction-modification methylase domain-containing protein [bacterium]
MSRELLLELIQDFSNDKLVSFFRGKTENFERKREVLDEFTDERFSEVTQLGTIKFSDISKIIVVSTRVKTGLTERACRKAQFEKAKKILSGSFLDGGIFVFHDSEGRFRFSLVVANYSGNKKELSHFRRFTYFVDRKLPNKSFLNFISTANFFSLDKVREAFSIGAVTKLFYGEFIKEFEALAESVESDATVEIKKDFALLFVIRTLFIGFIQKRGWIGGKHNFIMDFVSEYRKKKDGSQKLYSEWFKPLFFEAFNTAPGHKVKYKNNDFSEETESILQMAPYLNGGLFIEKKSVDDQGLSLSDNAIYKFIDFIFSYNFTIEENTLYDEELELNPEFLGVIFERLINKENGAVYTPRTEVDFMCRISLIKWIEKNNKTGINIKDLYELFFKERGLGEFAEEDQKRGSFSPRQKEEILDLIRNITVCDPAVGSGAFPVGMMHVLNEIEETIDKKTDGYERKKRIISNTLYGVEVKEWAVWITQLRLWITLFIEAPEELKDSFEPILPSLDFKIRCGDSLVQRVGSKRFPVTSHADIPQTVKSKVTKLKNLKRDFFYNKGSVKKWEIEKEELNLFKEILDTEINEKKKKIGMLNNKEVVEQVNIFGDIDIKDKQMRLNIDEKTRELLEKEIAELESEKASLKDDKPLIWNIEFSEIFSDKGGFDIVIGNPPYIRQEDISDPKEIIKEAKDYKHELTQLVRLDFFSDVSEKDFKKVVGADSKSDLYIYFYFRGLRLLNKTGIHTYICSNSWLDVGYGAWLQEFLLDKTKVHFIIDNHAKRSFDEADVNTIISVIDAPYQKSDDHLVKFVAFKKPFEETLYSENLIKIEDAKEITKTDEFRVYPIKTSELRESGTEYEEDDEHKIGGKFTGDKWGGKYLRAPDIFIFIKRERAEIIRNFKNLFDIFYGVKTGKVKFFYLDKLTINQFKIERDYYYPLVHTSQKINKIFI